MHANFSASPSALTARRNRWWASLLSLWLLPAVSFPVSAATNAWSTLGPEGGRVPRLSFSPTNTSIVYAVAADRLHRSLDGGLNWQQNTSAALRFVTDVAVDPLDGNRVYVVSADLGGVYVSTDAGAAFNVRQPFPAGVSGARQLLVAADEKTLYLATATALFASHDRGATWGPGNPVPGDRTTFDAATVDLLDPSTVYISVFGGGSFVTRDAGRTWQEMTFPTAGEQLRQGIDVFAINPLDPQRLYAANVSGLYVSIDQGRSFARRSSAPVQAIGLDLGDPDIIYIGGSGVQLSTDRGLSWVNVTGNLDSLAVLQLAPEPGVSNRVLVSTESGILRSESGGTTWQPSQAGINAHRITAFSMSDDAVYATSSAAALIQHGSDLLTPLNLGNLFTVLRTRSTELQIESLGSAAGHKVLGLVGGRLGRSENGGQSWQALAGLPRNTNIRVIGTSRGSPATVVAASQDKVFKSSDDGDSWEDVSAQFPGKEVTEVAFARSQPTTGYAVTFNQLPPSGGAIISGLFKTSDGGATWSEQPAPQLIRALEVDPVSPQTLYVSTELSMNKSTDAGATWVRLPLPIPDFGPSIIVASFGNGGIHVDPLNPRILYLATAFSVLRSVDGGDNWQALSPNLVLGNSNLDVVTDPARPGTVRVATERRSIQQMTIAPDLSIDATDMPAVLPLNAPISLHYTVTNRGPFDASRVRAELRLPDSAQEVSATMSGGVCSVAALRVTCAAQALLVSRPEVITLRFITGSSGNFAVNAAVSGGEMDPDSLNNSVVRTSRVMEQADLLVSLTGRQSAEPGSTFTYVLTASNQGPSPATDVRLTLQLAGGLALVGTVGADFTCSAATTLMCNIATLVSGQTAAITVNAAAGSVGVFQSTAQISGNGLDPLPANNGAMITTTVATAAPLPMPPSPTPTPTPAPAPARRGGGGGSMAPLLLLALALLALTRISHTGLGYHAAWRGARLPH
jgi:uncharacterized repeat protein (TIGR01451 family)